MAKIDLTELFLGVGMTDMAHEEIGSACKDCGHSPSMCDCVPCHECTEFYAFEDIKDGFCPDCHANYDSLDLEDKLEIALNQQSTEKHMKKANDKDAGAKAFATKVTKEFAENEKKDPWLALEVFFDRLSALSK